MEVDLAYEDRYRITLELLEEKVSAKTRMLIINYPNNPTGRVLTQKEAQVLRQFMLNHPDLVLLSDEMYERILFDGQENCEPRLLPRHCRPCHHSQRLLQERGHDRLADRLPGR